MIRYSHGMFKHHGVDIDLWGRAQIPAESSFELLYKGVDIWSLSIVEDGFRQEFNRHSDEFAKPHLTCLSPHTNTPEEEHATRSAEWFYGGETIDLSAFLHEKCQTLDQHTRVDLELKMFEDRDLIPLLKTMIELVKRFREQSVVWGVGRGSSVSSFILYLIGVHRINPMRYGLDIKDFLK